MGPIDLATLEGLRELGGAEGPDFLASLVRTYLEDAARRLAEAREALAHGDIAQIGALAHALKGSSAGIGALRMRQLAATLEQEARGKAVGPPGSRTLAEQILEALKLELADVTRALLLHLEREAAPQ